MGIQGQVEIGGHSGKLVRDGGGWVQPSHNSVPPLLADQGPLQSNTRMLPPPGSLP